MRLRSAHVLALVATAALLVGCVSAPDTATGISPSGTARGADATRPSVSPASQAARSRAPGIAGFEGPRSASGTPSDASVAVGPGHVLVSTNTEIALYGKDGRSIDGLALSDFFAPLLDAGLGTTDPRATFDVLTQRFVVAVSAGAECPHGTCPNWWMLAISSGPAPTDLRPSEWKFMRFNASFEQGREVAAFGDQNAVGTNGQLLVLSAQRVDAQNSSWATLWVFDLAALLSATPPDRPAREFTRLRAPGLSSDYVRIFPATHLTPTRTVFAASFVGESCSTAIFGITSATGKAQDAELVTQILPEGGRCPHARFVSQPGSVIAVYPRISSQPVFVSGHLWIAELLSSGPTAASIRVREIDVSNWPAAPRIVQTIVVGDPNISYAIPAISANAEGDFSVVAVATSVDQPPSVVVAHGGRGAPTTTRLARAGVTAWRWMDDQPDAPGGKAGRFADFSGASTDPLDGSAWLISTYSRGACEWGTWIDHGGPGPSPAPSTPTIAAACTK